MSKLNRSGVVELIALVIVLATISMVGWRVFVSHSPLTPIAQIQHR